MQNYSFFTFILYRNKGSRCSTNYWYKEDSNECVACNQGYFGNNCTELCPFPFYGVVCVKKCNCSVDDCHYATGCPVLQIETNGTTSPSEKRDTFNRKRLNLRIGVFVYGGILIVFVLLFLLIELRRRTRQSVVEQQIFTENAPAYE
ncbi:uncharacterized protein LOC134282708 [Saccostrea cucullata]|uniref:uncharacterized protein LOC134282708 n=1 Tax=Saccostrea cuccullata TaxID=36930 RepID=UPI002ED40D6D